MIRDTDLGGQSLEVGPVRLRDGAPEDGPAGLAAALRGAALAHHPTAAQRDDLRRALALAVTAGESGAPAGGAARPRLALREIVTLALLAAGGLAFWMKSGRHHAEPPPTSPASIAPAGGPPIPGSISAPLVPAVEPPGSDPPRLDRGQHGSPDRGPRSGDGLRLLLRAQKALDAEPAVALALTARHERLFPVSALAQEREVIAIEALRRLHRTDEAEARAKRFRSRYPGSAHLLRIEGRQP